MTQSWMDWIESVILIDGPSSSEHWSVNEEVNLNDCDEVIELIQTGSVTTQVNGKNYVIILTVQEA